MGDDILFATFTTVMWYWCRHPQTYRLSLCAFHTHFDTTRKLSFCFAQMILLLVFLWLINSLHPVVVVGEVGHPSSAAFQPINHTGFNWGSLWCTILYHWATTVSDIFVSTGTSSPLHYPYMNESSNFRMFLLCTFSALVNEEQILRSHIFSLSTHSHY